MRHPLKTDNLSVGLIIGMLFPAVIYLMLTLINESFADPTAMEGFRGFNLKGKMILSVLVNVIPFELYKRKHLNKSMTGVVGATVLLGIIMAIVLFTITP